jgi:hypothetical protein
VTIRILAFGFVCAAGLFGQYGHQRFLWGEACFKNPAAPYCQGHDFAIKPQKPSKDGTTHGTDSSPFPATPETETPSVIVVGGINWRFADPFSDALAGFNFNKLSASPLAHSLIAQLGASQGIGEADMRKIFERLSGIDQLAISLCDNRIVVMVTSHAADATLPLLDPGWKSVQVVGNAMLIGNAGAVDEAVQRISAQEPLTDLMRRAVEFQSESDFWVAGSGSQATGVKRFSLAASMGDHFTANAVFELNQAPDADMLKLWPATLAGATIDGNLIYVKASIEADEAQQRFGQLAGILLGQRLGALVKAARYLPLHDSNPKAHTKPVIYGLDDGPKEVNQYRDR